MSRAYAYALAKPVKPNYLTPGLNVPALVNIPLEDVLVFMGAVLLYFVSDEGGTLIDFGIVLFYYKADFTSASGIGFVKPFLNFLLLLLSALY